MKYAVVESGGKQYIAREGEIIEVDRLPKNIGQAIEFKDVLLIIDNGKVLVGKPFVRGARVRGKVVDHFKARKVIVFKFIPKERYRRKRGHRQKYSKIAISSIDLSSPQKKVAAPKTATKPKKTPAAKTTTKPKKTPAAKTAVKPKKTTSTRKSKPKAAKDTKTGEAKASTRTSISTAKATKPTKKKTETKKAASSTRTKAKKSSEK
jgi:large subunit ribosomal protein L21